MIKLRRAFWWFWEGPFYWLESRLYSFILGAYMACKIIENDERKRQEAGKNAV